ncbi:protein of unknown function [Taphrina deformans PYCC 5710]|uniref:PPPDE domain-containing protein n=1 Tax=Taphrina deformans (strain PYCC 5710 / ATCC 11124 / CBS 356.35 / IMI 108563 / JCM 9778 / NBRC 8474) TaxID=1097556 RepID=R4X900_TAPDE|nr:protein of unknown function [Taphrina deformans PYCC 5710]|eukprot:CCG81905.1 protein of unknown function [Taphrina deformans PYCC 5710]
MGTCNSDLQAWQKFLQDCAEDYGVGKYHLLEHNCNTFSDAALQFLLNTRIDPEISSLPSDFLNTPLGIMLRPQIDAMYSPQGAGRTSTLRNTRHEATIDGPTSGTRIDRVNTAYKFYNCPTLTKLFGAELTGPAKVLGDDLQEREQLRDTTRSIITEQRLSTHEIEKLHGFLLNYMRTGNTANIYPGIDLVRILFPHKVFSDFMSRFDNELLDLILSKTIGDSELDTNSVVVLFKLICNVLVNEQVRNFLVERIRWYKRIELITNGPLSSNKQVVELSLKTIWNVLILADGIDDDFAVACLAAVAERKSEEGSEITTLRNEIIKEITSGASEAIQEMVELLDIEC